MAEAYTDPNDKTKAAEYKVADTLITQIKAHDAAMNWAACP
jgi:hypothetical protein